MRALVGGRGAGRGEGREPGGESAGALASGARGQGGPLRATTEQGSVPLDSGLETRSQVSRSGDVLLASEGRARGCAQRGMTWSGVTARTDVTLSGLPDHSRLAPRGPGTPKGSFLCAPEGADT